jgi:hypothetical protein
VLHAIDLSMIIRKMQIVKSIDMKSKSLFLAVALFISLANVLNAKEPTQTIRGTVVDKDSKEPLVGVTIVLLDFNPLKGTITDLDGAFRLNEVPVGRVGIKVSHIGYEEKYITNILLSSGKETVLNIEINESVEKLEEVQVLFKKKKSESSNDMAAVSAKAFTVEETNRYAGSINDPARMVSSYAGVTGDAQGRNEIVVRGNSPKGIQWRLEGVEIPNPNHFASEGTTGGPVNALNSSMLANSDFYTGAFAPEYGNAYSGVFDMKLRNGNNEKREYSFSAGIMGTDFTAEGPFKKGNASSYLVNYRYSTLAILDNMGLVDFDGVPKYQDLSYKIVVSTENAGVFTTYGLFGKSKIFQEDIEDEDEEMMDFVYSSNEFGADIAVFGLKNTYLINDKNFLESALSYSRTGGANTFLERDDNNHFLLSNASNITHSSKRLSLTLNNKLNAKNKIQSGITYSLLAYDMYAEDHVNSWDRMVIELDARGTAGLLEAFASWKHRINDDLTLISGVHYTHFMYNDGKSIEPRASLKWDLNEKQSLTAGFGMHSKTGILSNYMVQQNHEDGSVTTPNKNLELMKARHYVVGYDNMISPNMHFNVELYYQSLYDVPVEDDISSTYSELNSVEGWTDRSLVNKGTGTNYGAEVTLEKFFASSYYFLVTASLYDSKYKALDGIDRDTRFNGHYAGNILAGKEFSLGNPKKGRALSVNTKVALIGGHRYTPINLERSIEENREIRFEDRPYSVKGSDIFKTDFSVSLITNKKNTTMELKLEVQNITNNKGLVTQYYNTRKMEIENSYQFSMFPVISYRIDF